MGYIPRVGGFGEADIICDFVRRNPDVTLVRRVGWGTELATMLTTGTVDTVLISLLGENPFDTIPALAVLKTPEYHIVQVSESRVLRIGVSENHPLARSKKITKEMFPQLRDEVFLFGLLPDTCPYEHSHKHTERLGLEGKMRCQFVDTTDRDVVLQLVRDGNGVLPQACFIPEVLNGALPSGGRLGRSGVDYTSSTRHPNRRSFFPALSRWLNSTSVINKYNENRQWDVGLPHPIGVSV